MFKKHWVSIGLAAALALLFTSTVFYPGGSQHDENAVGFSWQHNYLSNLLNPVAVNRQDNAALPWAVGGLLVLCAAVAVFFVRFSKKIPQKAAENVVKYAGAGSMIFAVFTATPYHDLAVRLSGTLLMLGIFYITVFIFKSRLRLPKVLSALVLLALYACSFIYYSSTFLEILPIAQKVNLLLSVGWVVALEYGVTAADLSLAAKET
jgi:hypothetical protein